MIPDSEQNQSKTRSLTAARAPVLRAEAGTMIVFPSWLYHFVNPFQGDGERISVSFNMQWQGMPA